MDTLENMMEQNIQLYSILKQIVGDFFVELDILLSKQAIFQMFILINIQKSKLTQMKKTLNMQNVVILS